MIEPVAVIGAGPFGLSTAAHLRARGVPAQIFGDPMVGWRDHMPAGMILKSTPAASDLDCHSAGTPSPTNATRPGSADWSSNRIPSRRTSPACSTPRTGPTENVTPATDNGPIKEAAGAT
ncbi:hypothetical protein GCM10011578_065840 [Streptomyces fuscichromogenes]|uniref:Uncharacterized protein n=1 Tax=Streptomyces fuscichromogenes TaxID=1324013 RepID=A0A918CUL4_9ACTN|nr:hypothetical protein GCM10011578_065840 [Streptomyces fuscichromogenes]